MSFDKFAGLEFIENARGQGRSGAKQERSTAEQWFSVEWRRPDEDYETHEG